MIEELLRSGRSAAEALMVDTCRVTRGGGVPVWDEETGTYTPVAGTTLYEGRCKVQSAQSQEQSPDAGEQRVTVQRYRLDLPVGAIRYREGDAVEILTSAYNPSLPGTLFTLAGSHDKSLQTAHRLPMDQVSADG